MNKNIDSDSGFPFTSSPIQHNISDLPGLPSLSSHAVNYDPNNRKNRSKLIKIDSGQFQTCSSTVSRPKYAKKPDPAAPKITRPCSECGRKFWSWKALFGHMRCHPERQWRGINPPPNYRQPVYPVKQSNNVDALMTEEDHEIAASLLTLANGAATAAASEGECDTNYQPGVQENDAFGANFRFKCSSCKKVFGSSQALGGHRASHKNIKGCFEITRSEGYEVEDQSGRGDGLVKENVEENSKSMMVLPHKCSICLRGFSSGQALGGHKRCHWEKGDETSLNHGLNLLATRQDCSLDLNLPASVENDSSSSYYSGLALDLRLGL